jgi:hypothetical protein
MSRSLNLLSLLIFFSTSAYAQKADEQLLKIEEELIGIYNQILLSEENDERENYNHTFFDLLYTTLAIKGSFDYPFDNLPTISKMQSDDNMLRVFSWNLQNNEGEHRYYGVVQLNPKALKSKTEKAIMLINEESNLMKYENKSLGPEHWPGAVYYQIISIKKGKQKYYTLAGWRGIDNGLTQKLIDVVYISNESVKFGYPIFKVEKKTQRRLVFSYNAKTTMHLRYDDKLEQFIFDHLAPSSNLVSGQYRFYGPDGSYDALRREKKQWLYIPNVDAKNQAKESDIFYTPVTQPNID